jgi:nucleoside 2-deoxyribosyltransferase
VQNVRRAEAAGLQVAELGASPIIPHKNTENFHGLLPDAFWLNATTELMRRADAVYMFDPADYDRSQGTHDEVDTAKKLGIPVFKHIADLEDWLKEEGKAA